MSFRLLTSSFFRASCLTLASLFALAPAGCADDADSPAEGATPTGYQFGLEEMRREVEGEWSGRLAFGDRAETDMTLRLEYVPRDERGTAPALSCGIRTLNEALYRCGGQTAMEVRGTLSTADGTYQDVVVEGEFSVPGYVMERGRLSLSTQIEDFHFVDVPWAPGGFVEGTLRISKDSARYPVGTVAMVR
jgi:hypothetical protein